MKKFLGAILLVSACVALVFAVTVKSPATLAAPPTVSDSVKQLEHDWVDAMKANNTDKLGAILADDWSGIGPDGAMETKASYLAPLKSGDTKLTSFDFGPMTVFVMGNVAVVQGSDTEKSMTKGKDTSGKFVWMDVFAMRKGNWQAVRSQTAMVK